MDLKEYKRKRDFKKTPEPVGVVERSKSKKLSFVIQKHDATRLHYDFRLELDGVLKSWAVPKGPSLDPKKKSLAVQVEDHPLDYGDFEGVIPEGQYGGGTVLLWDRGTWEPVGDPRAGLAAGKIHFVLDGEKLRGEFALIQMHGRAGEDGKNWLLFKVSDKFADADQDILKKDKSVKTKRSLDKIAGDRDDVWNSKSKKTKKATRATQSTLPKNFSPQLAVLAEHPPQGDDWLHEIKFDGYRILAFIRSGNVELYSRNGNEYTSKFRPIADALKKLDVDSALLDGEAVVLDENGKSDFQSLQAMLKQKERVFPTYFAFDMPFCDGADLTKTPLIERKNLLEDVLKRSKLSQRVQYSDHVRGDGDAVIHKACNMSLEGIVSKRADSPYVSKREPTWIKSKCDQRQEFVIIGFTDPQGSRTGFGSLLLGVHNDKKQLVYAGRVGTGFDDRLLTDMHKQMKALEIDSPPTDTDPPARERRHAHWIKPKLVGEVRFTGWTRENVLRHPAFMGLRVDKKASEVVREKVQDTEVVVKKAETSVQGVNLQSKGASSTSRDRKGAPSVPGKQAGGRRASAPGAPSQSQSISKTSRKSAKARSEGLSVAGVRISHPDKILYPEQGTTKFDLANYYEVAAKWMLPHVVDRPLALVRCPEGSTKKCFFQRNWSNALPKAIGKADVSQKGEKEVHVAIDDVAGLISLVQMGVLEVHTWNCHREQVENPDQLIFDLDPGPDVSWKQIVTAARIVRDTLDALKLPTFLKTSGGKGLHLTIPIEPEITWDEGKSFCETIAKDLEQRNDLFVANMRKDLRNGKVYIDYHRNGRTATAVAPYSSRARQGAPVSMPISWEELGKLSSANQFTVETASRYLQSRRSDPWRDFSRRRVDLRKLIHRKSAA